MGEVRAQDFQRHKLLIMNSCMQVDLYRGYTEEEYPSFGGNVYGGQLLGQVSSVSLLLINILDIRFILVFHSFTCLETVRSAYEKTHCRVHIAGFSSCKQIRGPCTTGSQRPCLLPSYWR